MRLLETGNTLLAMCTIELRDCQYMMTKLVVAPTLPVLWKNSLNSSSSFHICLASRLNCKSTGFRRRTPIILFKSLPADWADGIGYVSSTVMLEGV